MSRWLVWRCWLHRIAAVHERWLKVVTRAGFGGLVLALVLYRVAPEPVRSWTMVLMGISLVMAGVGHALLGEEVSVRSYATGESEAMPLVGRMACGLLASCGGVLIVAMGLAESIG